MSSEFGLIPYYKKLKTNSEFSIWTAKCKLVPKKPPPYSTSAPIFINKKALFNLLSDKARVKGVYLFISI